MPLPLSCPSCNTPFSLPQLPADRRATCPRCGDTFPIRGQAAEAPNSDSPAAHDPSLGLGTQPPTDTAERKSHARLSATRAVLLAVAMGFVGLGIGLWVALDRDQSAPRPEEPGPQRPEGLPVAAGQLEGLGYLPRDSNVVFAVQPGPVLAYAARTNQDVTELLTKAGLPPQVLATVGNLGLTLPQIDHLVGGTSLGNDAVELRLALALVLRRPVADEGEFLRRLKAKKLPGGKVRYDVELSGLPLTLARVSPIMWVFGYDAKKDLEAVDAGGRGPGGGQFPAGLAEMIRERVAPDAAAWLATNDERWAEKPGVKLVVEKLMKKPEWLPTLAQGRAAVASVSFGDPPRVRLFVKAADDAIGQRVRDGFRRRATRDDRIVHGGGGELAFFDAPIDPATISATLQQLLGEPAKK